QDCLKEELERRTEMQDGIFPVAWCGHGSVMYRLTEEILGDFEQRHGNMALHVGHVRPSWFCGPTVLVASADGSFHHPASNACGPSQSGMGQPAAALREGVTPCLLPSCAGSWTDMLRACFIRRTGTSRSRY